VKGQCYRELPLTLRLDDGTLVEGIADMVFLDAEKCVVDFRTDQRSGGVLCVKEPLVFAACCERSGLPFLERSWLLDQEPLQRFSQLLLIVRFHEKILGSKIGAESFCQVIGMLRPDQNRNRP